MTSCLINFYLFSFLPTDPISFPWCFVEQGINLAWPNNRICIQCINFNPVWLIQHNNNFIIEVFTTRVVYSTKLMLTLDLAISSPLSP